ncbi:MAG TPA: aminotransferase class I/II-fold pyridoxal phosphate-dependent enzyme [Nevskiaceae bacterium]|nr:aminotransferase class I/II-fold pyridoxal phosphate-dependent enzyme [Nevskiaceae bacterium]
MKLETLAIHAGRRVISDTRGIVPAIELGTTFERGADGSFPGGHIYARNSNPNRAALEQCLAALEGGSEAIAFPSGSAATAAVLQALAPGDHLIIPADLYWGTAVIARDLYARWGLQHSMVDLTDLGALQRALTPKTKLVWVETPSNPLLKLTDIRAAVQIAHAANALCVVDSTFATPVLQRPLELGADLVMHSTTKYLGGHSDVLGGALIGRGGEFMARVRDFQTKAGAAPAPFDCWLLQRSIASLAVRVRAQCDSARRVAEFLERHPRVERVHYPGLPSHAQHALARAQMSSGGAMLSLQVRGGRDEAMGVAARLTIFTRATSLGGVESLVEHRASVEGPDTRTPQNLLRVSIGLEHADDLIADFQQALEG